jgi:hypothetical protein
MDWVLLAKFPLVVTLLNLNLMISPNGSRALLTPYPKTLTSSMSGSILEGSSLMR